MEPVKNMASAALGGALALTSGGLKRVLAYHHFAGASERRVVAATRLIQEAGSPQDLARIVVKDGRRLGDLQRTGGIALEIAANEASEQRLLELEPADLEAHWRREEELAALAIGSTEVEARPGVGGVGGALRRHPVLLPGRRRRRGAGKRCGR